MMKKGKAPGDDKITADMLKADTALSAGILYPLLSRAWEEETTPKDFRNGTIITLPKKGDLRKCDNWRGITLLSVPGKVLCRIIYSRLRASLEKILNEDQAGFRRERSCTDHIFVMRTIIEQALEWNTAVYLHFIDFEKAFDSVHQKTMWRILKSYGIPGKVVSIIKSLYEGSECKVRHGGTESNKFTVKSGVRQGCILSPFLFLIVMDYVMKRAMVNRLGLQWSLMDQLEHLDFADDICLLSQSSDHLQRKTNQVLKEAQAVGLTVNVGKSKTMKINRRKKDILHVQNEPVEDVKDFVYLGSTVSADGHLLVEIKSRIAKATSAFHKLHGIWKSRIYSIKTKTRLYKTCVRSVLLYGAETWKTDQKIESILRGFEGRCLRRILGFTWEDRISNERIREITGMKDINLDIKERWWRWTGHVLRMKSNRRPRQAMRWTPEGYFDLTEVT